MFCRVSRLVLACTVALSVASCGGGDDSGPTPTPSSSSGGGGTGGSPPAPSNLPPAPFGLTATASFALVGWQQTSQGNADPILAPAPDKAALGWSATEKTYTAVLTDFGSGKLVYTFPGNNPAAFSLITADGSKAPVSVSLYADGAAMGRVFWQSADGVQPFVYATAMFGIPTAQLPTSGTRVFVTDTSPQSSLVVDFTTRKVSGTVTTAYTDAWGPYNNKVRAVMDPADLQPDGSFAGVIAVPGAPRQGELRGRLFGPGANELGLYWNGPALDGYDSNGWTEWRAVMGYVACTSCTP